MTRTCATRVDACGHIVYRSTTRAFLRTAEDRRPISDTTAAKQSLITPVVNATRAKAPPGARARTPGGSRLTLTGRQTEAADRKRAAVGLAADRGARHGRMPYWPAPNQVTFQTTTSHDSDT
jgi:hypothetical protein